jgi:O-antigen/teichoic acid export membrane protein
VDVPAKTSCKLMTKNKLLSDISISSAQAILNQLSGIVVFFIISKYLTKSGLGHISILGFGLEHIAVRKTATGDADGLLQSYLLHVFITGTAFLLLVWLIQENIPALQQDGRLFLLLSVSQCFSFFATPFRQVVNGLEKFKAFFFMSSCANIIKVILLLVLAVFNNVSLPVISKVYLVASFTELVACVLIYRVKLHLPIVSGFAGKKYFSFLKEALPQLGITVFNTAVARMDWILLGLLSTAVMVAEYSFANKIFELVTLPLLILAPVIFPKIAKLFGNSNAHAQTNKINYLQTLMRLEIVIAVLVMLAVNICWKDIIDPLTDNKYGLSTRPLIFIISFAMPLLYINHIFWSILFAQEKMRTLFLIFLLTFVINLSADALLIPFYQARGAAVGYVIALFTQTCFYFYKTESVRIRNAVFHLLPVIISALMAGFISLYLFDFFIWQLIIAMCIYFFLLWMMQQVKKADWLMIRDLMAARS